jgi:hypothetical protein
MKFKSLPIVLMIFLLSIGHSYGQGQFGFMIQNEQINGNQFEFDVYAFCNQAGTYHSRGQVYLNYSGAFGDSAISNGRVTFSQLSLLNETIPFFGNKYTTIGFIDNSPSRFALTWQTNFPSANPSTVAHTQVPTLLTPLYHVTMQIVDPNVPIEVSFEQRLMNRQQFQIIAANTEIPYGDWVFPVELLDFQATVIGADAVRLDWATSQEVNNDRFVIEKQIEQGEFIKVAEVKGAGTTDEMQSYHHIDRTPMGEVNYYRLKQVDLDGTETYSKLLEVRYDPNAVVDFSVYPNPTDGLVNLKVNGLLDYDRNYSLLSLQGQVLQQGILKGQEPLGVIRLDLSRQAAGMYLLKVQDEAKAFRIIKK